VPEVFVTMAMSLDGFITGPHDDAENPAGINGMRLMDWLGGGGEGGNDPHDYRPTDPNSRIELCQRSWTVPRVVIMQRLLRSGVR
jgi:hypothetical protein